MSNPEVIPWQGNLLVQSDHGLLIKSRHKISGIHVFGPDSDYTTLAISGLEYLTNSIKIQSFKVDQNLDHMTIQACAYSIDEDSEWHIKCIENQAAVQISKLDVNIDFDQGYPIDPNFIEQIENAWMDEMLAVSQGAFVSEQAYRSAASSRLNLTSQTYGETKIWPPREMVGDVVPEIGDPLAKEGTIETWTKLSAGGAPSEFSLRAPILDGISTVFVQLSSGPKGVFLLADDEESQPRIGQTVTFAVRRIYAQEGLIRYGLKALIA